MPSTRPPSAPTPLGWVPLGHKLDSNSDRIDCSDEKSKGSWAEDAVGPDETNNPTWNHMTLLPTESIR